MSVDVLKEIENKGDSLKAFDLGTIEIEKVAHSYMFLQKIIDGAKKAQSKLAPTLLEANSEFLFKEEEMKVVVTPGKVTKTIDPLIVTKYCSIQSFAEMVSITEKSIKATYEKFGGSGFAENVDVIIAKASSVTGEGNPSVKAKKMTKKEIQG